MSDSPVQPEMAPATRLMVLMFTDVVSSLDMKRRIGDAAYAQLINAHDVAFKQVIASTPHAEILKDVGDGFLARFVTPSDAINAALRFQYLLNRGNWKPAPLRVRIGLHLGEVTEIDKDLDGLRKVVGLPADIAARIMSLAQGGQILLTRASFDSARQNIRRHPSIPGDNAAPPEIRWMAYGRYAIKGIEEPIEVFEVGAEGIAPFTSPPDSEKAKRAYSLEEEETLGWRPAAGLEIPRRPGWIIDRKLGEGGFGEVWLGRHHKTFDQRVFKFCFDAERLQSFKRELTLFRLIRHALGERKDIAKLHEVQLETSPYFLESEFSEHGDLQEWSKQQGGIDKVPMEQRIDMIARIATAAAAAHSVGILHKDIKPSNILIRREENNIVRPVLADFGIGVVTDTSRLSDLRMTTGSGFTETVENMDAEASRTGTRMYAPPEILANKPFTVQGDVFALGVLLYQVVAGDLEKPLASGWERDVEDELVRADIAACVEGDPRRRLGSATELAKRLRDLPQRRLDKTREAQAAAALIRMRKLRYWGVAGVIMLGLVAAILGYGFVRERGLRARAVAAEKEAENQKAEAMIAEARATVLASFFRAILESADPNKSKTGEVKVIQLLDEAAQGAQLRFAKDPQLKADILHTVGVAYEALGQLSGAQKNLAEAVELRQKSLGALHIETLNSEYHLANTLAMLNRARESIDLKRHVLTARKEVLGPHHRDTLASMDSLALSLYYSGDLQEAETMRMEVFELRQKHLGQNDPDTISSIYNVAQMAMDRREFAEAESLHRKVLELRIKVLGEQHTDTVNSRTSLARALSSMGKHEEAQKTLRQVVELQTRRLGEDHLITIMARNSLAQALLESGDAAEAESLLRELLVTLQDSSLPLDHWSTLRTKQNLADSLSKQDKLSEAEPLYREVLAARLTMPGGDRNKMTIEVMRSLAKVLEKNGKTSEAGDLRKKADEAERTRPISKGTK